MLAFVVADPQAGHDPTVIGILTIVSIDILIVAPYHRSFALLRILTVCCLTERKGEKESEREREERRKISRCMHALPLRWDMIESISLINDTSENIREWKFIRSFWLLIEWFYVLSFLKFFDSWVVLILGNFRIDFIFRENRLL